MKYATEQPLEIKVFDSNNAPVTGQAGNISCTLQKDGTGSYEALTNNTFTEVATGRYATTVTVAETTCHQMSLVPVCPGYQAYALPSNLIFTSLETSINNLLGDLIVVASTPSTDSVSVTVNSTETVQIVCDRDTTGLTLTAVVQAKLVNSWTTIATVNSGSISNSSTVASFAMTTAMTGTAGVKRIIISNSADSDVVASPLLFVSERLPQ